MNPKKFGYINDVDRLIEQTSLDQVLLFYGASATVASSGEHRMLCMFNEKCVNSQYGHLTVNLDDTANRIYCHSCGVRGNLLTLIHGLEKKEPPASGRLRGAEFKAAVARLREIAGDPGNETAKTRTAAPHSSVSELPSPSSGNVPLIHHDKESARALHDLGNDLISDVSQMSPEAAKYVRCRPWMTPELLQKWGVGWIPGDGRSLFRKQYLVYTHRNERGDVLSFSGRDLFFEAKWQKWLHGGKPEDKKPHKHRYVSGYHRGLELYGGHVERLKEPYVAESLARRGVVVTEGMNEVLRMETLGVAAVSLGSNKATEHQIEKLTRFARSAGDNRIVLLPDCDEEGETAFKDLLWKLAERHVDVTLGCSSRMFSGRFASRQPEDFSLEDWQQIDEALRQTESSK